MGMKKQKRDYFKSDRKHGRLIIISLVVLALLLVYTGINLVKANPNPGLDEQDTHIYHPSLEKSRGDTWNISVTEHIEHVSKGWGIDIYNTTSGQNATSNFSINGTITWHDSDPGWLLTLNYTITILNNTPLGNYQLRVFIEEEHTTYHYWNLTINGVEPEPISFLDWILELFNNRNFMTIFIIITVCIVLLLVFEIAKKSGKKK